MTLKATILYSKIARQLRYAEEEDALRANQLQDSLLAKGRWTPVGQIYLDNNMVDEPKHREILHFHRVTNRTENDKAFGDWLVENRIVDAKAASAVFARARNHPPPFDPDAAEEPPFLPSAFLEDSAASEETLRRIREFHEFVYQKLGRMTGYGSVLVEDKGDLTYGRLSFQLGYVIRAALFASVHAHAVDDAGKRLREILLDRGAVNEVEDQTIERVIGQFVPG